MVVFLLVYGGDDLWYWLLWVYYVDKGLKEDRDV